MASASPRLPQALTPTGLFRHPQVPEGILDSGKSSYSSVLVVLFRQILLPKSSGVLYLCMYMGLGISDSQAHICTHYLTRGGALSPPETHKPRTNKSFVRGFFVHSHTRNRAYFMNHRPSRQNTESSADFQEFKALKKVAFNPQTLYICHSDKSCKLTTRG